VWWQKTDFKGSPFSYGFLFLEGKELSEGQNTYFHFYSFYKEFAKFKSCTNSIQVVSFYLLWDHRSLV